MIHKTLPTPPTPELHLTLPQHSYSKLSALSVAYHLPIQELAITLIQLGLMEIDELSKLQHIKPRNKRST